MDKNSTPKRLPGTGKKSGDEGLQEKGQAGSEALSFSFTQDGKEITKIGEYRIQKISGFKMARLVCLLTFLSLSCSYKINLTEAQREQKKFERFKIAPKEAIILSGAAFIGYGTGKHFARIKD
jgi:hypothetical protein